jgi:hypothetical protein
MSLRVFLTANFALLAFCAAAVGPQRAHAGSTDAVFISSGQSTATTETAPYDSEYAAAQREMGNGMNAGLMRGPASTTPARRARVP